MSSWRQGVPEEWFDKDILSQEEADLLKKPRAIVAQKCTGRSKKPVFLLPDKVVKGPWHLPFEKERLNRELGRLALMSYWLSEHEYTNILLPVLYPHEENQRIYLVTPALYKAPGDGTLRGLASWEVATSSRSASAVGPKWLDVIDRSTLGVVRVSDRVGQDPIYVLEQPGVWEHLLHRYILECGDSGLHNMLVAPETHRPVGLDVDEQRNTNNEVTGDWVSCLFKRAPAKRTMPWLERSWRAHQELLRDVIAALTSKAHDDTSTSIARRHDLDHSAMLKRIGKLPLFLASNC